MKFKSIPLLLLLFFPLISGYPQKQDSIIKRNPEEMKDKMIPTFSRISLSGKYWNNDSLKGKVTLIAFWYIGCIPCMREISLLNKLHREYSKSKDFLLISMAPQIKEDLSSFNNDSVKNVFSTVRSYFKAEPIEYEIIPTCDVHGKRKDTTNFYLMPECENIIQDFKVWGYPQIFISDKKGFIRFVHGGFAQEPSALDFFFNLYKTEIDELLKN